MIAIIAAIARGGAIGYQGRMPWHLPEDMQHFRDLTRGKAIIMGRKTHESIGRDLPGRRNIVVTSTGRNIAVGCEVVSNLADALHITGVLGHLGAPVPDRVAFILGGVGIFTSALPLADRLHLTELDFNVPADTFWQPDLGAFREVERRPGRTLGLSFVTWERKR